MARDSELRKAFTHPASAWFDDMPSSAAPPRPSSMRWIVLTGLVLAVIGAALLPGDRLSLTRLAGQERTLLAWRDQNLVLAGLLAFALYVAVTGLSLPGAAGMTLLYGWFFGLSRGVLIVSFASTAGATIAFLTSRYLLRDAVQRRFGDRLTTVNRALEQEGAFYLFSLRLIPLVPFFVLNLVMGLTPMKTRTYWWVSQLGMFPATCVYVYAGSVIPSLQALADQGIQAILTPAQLTQIFGAFTLLGLLPLVARRLVTWRAGKRDVVSK